MAKQGNETVAVPVMMSPESLGRVLLEIKRELGEVSTKVKSMSHTLEDNGQKGLVTKHNELETRVSTIEELAENSKQGCDRWLTIAALLVAIAALCVNYRQTQSQSKPEARQYPINHYNDDGITRNHYDYR